MGIYVEIFIRAPVEPLWEKSQQPELHQQWDLRFTHIDYLPRPDPSLPQRFSYATHIGFGLAISGEGETVATRGGSDGKRTSALKFWSVDWRSLIKEGSGYWQYVPCDEGVRFLTWYDYHTRFGAAGYLLDRAIFRPMMGWATAWSFDRLRLWIEKGIDPAVSLQRSLIHVIARLSVAFVWLYQGLAPKLLFLHPDEIDMLVASGLSETTARTLLPLLGGAEVAMALLLLLAWNHRWPLLLTIALMVVAVAPVAIFSPAYLAAPFNPISLNLAVAALSLTGYLLASDLPSERRCLRKRPEKHHEIHLRPGTRPRI